MPGALAALRQDKLPVAVVTSATRRLARLRLNRAGLPAPSVMVTADDVVHGKPHPQPYLRAAELLNLDTHMCVVVEDTPAGLAAARAAGATPLVLLTTHHAYELTQAHAVLRNLTDLCIKVGEVSWA